MNSLKHPPNQASEPPTACRPPEADERGRKETQLGLTQGIHVKKPTERRFVGGAGGARNPTVLEEVSLPVWGRRSEGDSSVTLRDLAGPWARSKQCECSQVTEDMLFSGLIPDSWRG